MAVAAYGDLARGRSEQARSARFDRLVALVIDSVVLAVISLVVNLVFGVAQITSATSFTIQVPWPVLTLVWLAYMTGFEAVFGATPGKLVAHLRVVRVDGRPLGLRPVLVRNLLRLIDALPILYLLGGMSVLLTANSQRIGDRWAGTTVVRRHHVLDPDETRQAGPRAQALFAAVVAALVLFTAVFNYVLRPPLVIEGMFNTHGFPLPGVTSYRLGPPVWGFGTVTYPVTATTSETANCEGSITLRLELWGWTPDGGQFVCMP